MSSEVAQKVEQVNALLLSDEPGNISIDEHSGYTGYKPQAIVDALNEAFGIGAWGFEEVSSEIVPGEKGAIAIAQVSVWLKGVDFKPTSWGQNRVTRGDVGDAKKGAQTDAIKKALSYFSIGNRAYHGLLKEGNGVNARLVVGATKPKQATPPVLRNGDGTPAVSVAPSADAQTMDKIRAFCKSLNRPEPTEQLTQPAAERLLKSLQVDYRDKKAAKGAA